MDPNRLFAELGRYLEASIPGHAPVPPATLSLPELVEALTARQLHANAAFRRLHAALRMGPLPVRDLAAIPAVPVVAYKETELTTVPPEERVAVFHSSGTTERTPSAHHHSEATLGIYRLALESAFKRHLLMDLPWAPLRRRPRPDERLRVISLTPSRAAAPRSSLVYMLDTLVQLYGAPESCFVGRVGAGGWELEGAAAQSALTAAEVSGCPVLLLGTAFSFVHLLDGCAANARRWRLPAGSRVMETGGYKGRSREIPKAELHRLITDGLGIPGDHIVCEYGMSELSSQAYDRVIGAGSSTAGQRRFHFPAWCQVEAISPENGRPVPPGQPGLLRVVDLANVASVLAVQTEDLAVREDGGFQLLGRAALAEPRGCSLMPVA